MHTKLQISREEQVIQIVRATMPARFIENVSDEILLAYINMVLTEFNWTPPRTGFTLKNIPASLLNLLALGCQVYGVMFLAGGYALNDFNYSDGGLSLTIDRQGNLDKYQQKLFDNYIRQLTTVKKCFTTMLNVNVAITPTVNTVFAQYLGSLFPTTFNMFK